MWQEEWEQTTENVSSRVENGKVAVCVKGRHGEYEAYGKRYNRKCEWQQN